AHPALPWALAALAAVGLGTLHPSANTLLTCIAQIAFYAAILAPLLWVARLTVTAKVLRRLLLILWGFHSASAAVGLLQVYYPGRFQPNVSTSIQAMGAMAEGMKITLANGERVWRPMGLTDAPGGACMAGLYAFLFGIGFFLGERSQWLRAAALGSMLV